MHESQDVSLAPKQANCDIFRTLGLSSGLASVVGKFVTAMDIFGINPPVIDHRNAAEVLYDMMPIGERLFEANITFYPGTNAYIKPVDLKTGLQCYFNQSNLPYFGNAPAIEIVSPDITKIPPNLAKSKVVILDGLLKGLVPSNILKLFPDLGLVIANTEEGPIFGGNHKVLDALQINPLWVYLLTQSEIIAKPDVKAFESDRRKHHRIIDAANVNAEQLLVATAKVGAQTKGPDAYLYIPQITDKSRIIPIPIPIGDLLDANKIKFTISRLFGTHPQMEETPLAKALEASRIGALPPALVAKMYKLATSLTPQGLLPPVAGLVSIAPPTRPQGSWKITNPDLGNQISSISVNLGMFTQWGTPLVILNTAYLPVMNGSGGKSGFKKLVNISVTGSNEGAMNLFADKLEIVLNELKG